MDFLEVGPFALAVDRAAAIVAIALFVAVCGLLAARAGRPLEGAAWLAAAVGAAAARAGFVATHWPAFRDEPLTILAFWQGGFAPAWGVAAAALVLVVVLRSRRAAAHALGALALATFAWVAALNALQREPREPLPDAPLVRLDGTATTLHAYAGRPLVVNVWATWCPPCRRELPLLARTARERPETTFVFLASGEDAATVRTHLAATGIALTNVVVDLDGAASARLGVRGLPTTLFVAPDRRVVARHAGEIGRAQLLDGLVRAAANSAE